MRIPLHLCEEEFPFLSEPIARLDERALLSHMLFIRFYNLALYPIRLDHEPAMFSLCFSNISYLAARTYISQTHLLV